MAALPEPRLEIGVDVGGTFTDFALWHNDRVITEKLPTTPDDPSRAVFCGLNSLLEAAGLPASALRRVVHGTTLVANAITERKGVNTALLTTRGARDIIEIGESRRYDRYSLRLRRPDPLAPRWLRRELSGRLIADGAELESIRPAEVRATVTDLVGSGVESLAVCLLHSYQNPVQEIQVGAVLREAFPALDVTLSHQIAPDIREYERTSTTVASAYVSPVVRRYVASILEQLSAITPARLFVMLSSGGITTPEAASRRPIHMVESGAAAGAIAGAHYTVQAGVRRAIGFDMGGTTAKICLIDDGIVARNDRVEVARVDRFRAGSGLPLLVPSVEVLEIGAGGGSIAKVDAFGLLHVGPESAGAEPGPACYGKGGTEPTVTDADLILGWLDEQAFLGGKGQLVRELAEDSLARLAGQLHVDVRRAAAGIVEVVSSQMASAMRIHVTEHGQDPRGMTLVAFGGAAPVHAAEVARLIGIRTVVIPLAAGVLSSIGLLAAAPAVELTRAHLGSLRALDWKAVTAQLDALENEAVGILTSGGATASEITVAYWADVRFVGQGYEFSMPLPANPAATMVGLLHDQAYEAYRRRYGLIPGELEMEIMRVRVRASGQPPPIDLARVESDSHKRRGPRRRLVDFPGHGTDVHTDVHSRYDLEPGDRLIGPAIIEERDSTVVVPPLTQALVDPHRNLILTFQGSNGEV